MSNRVVNESVYGAADLAEVVPQAQYGHGTALQTAVRPAAGMTDGSVRQAWESDAPYVNPRTGFCRAKEDTCLGRHTKDSEFCAGHRRSQV